MGVLMGFTACANDPALLKDKQNDSLVQASTLVSLERLHKCCFLLNIAEGEGDNVFACACAFVNL